MKSYLLFCSVFFTPVGAPRAGEGLCGLGPLLCDGVGRITPGTCGSITPPWAGSHTLVLYFPQRSLSPTLKLEGPGPAHPSENPRAGRSGGSAISYDNSRCPCPAHTVSLKFQESPWVGWGEAGLSRQPQVSSLPPPLGLSPRLSTPPQLLPLPPPLVLLQYQSGTLGKKIPTWGRDCVSAQGSLH